jgi:ankyrin repeat protein
MKQGFHGRERHSHHIPMRLLNPRDELATALVDAIRAGDTPELQRLLSEHPDAAAIHVGESFPGGTSRSLLHTATDWPGHFPNVAETIRLLIAAGADVNARCNGAHTETPLHWAASSNDIAALDALLDAGADIDANGAVIANGTPLSDAVAFAQWDAARRLVERGASMRVAEAAALGIMPRVTALFLGEPPAQHEVDLAFWYACHGGQREAAEYLLEQGANVNWLPDWERKTPLDAAQRNNFTELLEWLRHHGGVAAIAVRP